MIIIELYPALAPVTVANFLRYVDENLFADACFYRVVRRDNQPTNKIKIGVIQGGMNDDAHLQMLPGIIHETTEQTGIQHKDGTISMARNEPGSASSEFFICIGDQPELDFGGRRNSDGEGFAAFGLVLAGMDIVRKIQSQAANGQQLTPTINILAVERV